MGNNHICWGRDPFSTDAVYLCSHGFIRLVPHGACLRKDVKCGRCLVLMEFLIEVCILILGILCMMGIRRCFCSSDVYVGKEVTNNALFCKHICIR